MINVARTGGTRKQHILYNADQTQVSIKYNLRRRITLTVTKKNILKDMGLGV